MRRCQWGRTPCMPRPPTCDPDAISVPTQRQRHAGNQASNLFREDTPCVSRLYTVAMMADLLEVSRATLRHWQRSGLIVPTHSADSIDWYDYATLVVARDLNRLRCSGLSLRAISHKLIRLADGDPQQAASLAGQVVVDGQRLSLRQAGTLLDAGGQRHLDFYVNGMAGSNLPATASPPTEPVTLAFRVDEDRDTLTGLEGTTTTDELPTADDLLDLAAELDAAGQLSEAAEALRAVLQAEGPSAAVAFMLAETLYRAGDLTAARERYYAAIELDPDHLEARTSLGCVLAEQHDFELAAAAFEGVLRQQPDYADAHWHLAGVLAELDHAAAARRHLVTFLDLAPESPWADVARDKLALAND